MVSALELMAKFGPTHEVKPWGECIIIQGDSLILIGKQSSLTKATTVMRVSRMIIQLRIFSSRSRWRLARVCMFREAEGSCTCSS